MKIGIFFGSSTGNTELAAHKLKDQLAELVEDPIHDVRNADPEMLARYDVLFLGVSTWNIGEMQDDWAEFLPKLESVDLTGTKVALFAMGDAEGYPYNFLDAMGELWQVVKGRGAELVGTWPSASYQFDDSQAKYDDEHFLGLGLDEDNESDLTDERIQNWLLKVFQELGFDIGAAAWTAC